LSTNDIAARDTLEQEKDRTLQYTLNHK